MSRYHTICQYVCLGCSSPAQKMDCSPKPKATGEPTKKGHCTLLPTVWLSNDIAAAEEIHISSFFPLCDINEAHHISCDVHWMGQLGLIWVSWRGHNLFLPISCQARKDQVNSCH